MNLQAIGGSRGKVMLRERNIYRVRCGNRWTRGEGQDHTKL